jgi:hypothetical protein
MWLAEARDGALLDVRCDVTRDELTEWLIAQAARDPNLVVGLDFAFSLPAWYLRELGLDVRELWARMTTAALTPRMAALGLPKWFVEPDPPFWIANKAASGPGPGEEFRRTEVEVGSHPKSVFQLVGAGQVGRGSLYGLKALHRLAEGGFSIWPFDRAQLPLVVEIFPRLLTGPVVKSDAAARTRYLSALPIPRRSACKRPRAITLSMPPSPRS